MDLKEAIERNLVLRTEYGVGPEFLGGLLKRRVLKRRRYKMDGGSEDDVVHEREISFGPFSVVHRSKNPNLLSGDDYKLAVTFFRLFTVSNDKDFLVLLKAGPSLGAVKTLLGATPAAIPAALVDLNCAARAGFRLNLTRLLRDLKNESSDEDEEAVKGTEEPDIDLD